ATVKKRNEAGRLSTPESRSPLTVQFGWDRRTWWSSFWWRRTGTKRNAGLKTRKLRFPRALAISLRAITHELFQRSLFHCSFASATLTSTNISGASILLSSARSSFSEIGPNFLVNGSARPPSKSRNARMNLPCFGAGNTSQSSESKAILPSCAQVSSTAKGHVRACEEDRSLRSARLKMLIWWRRTGSNRRPWGYESHA